MQNRDIEKSKKIEESAESDIQKLSRLILQDDEASIAEIKKLLEQKIDLNISVNKEQHYPLHLAICRSNLALITLFLNHGADPNLPNAKGETPIQFALNQKLWAEVTHLAQHNPNTHTKENLGKAVWLLLIYKKKKKIRKYDIGYSEIDQASTVLLNANIDPNFVMGDKKLSLLHLATKSKNQTFIQKLLAKGAHPAPLNSKNQTPLEISLSHPNSWGIMQLLIDQIDLSTLSLEIKEQIFLYVFRDNLVNRQPHCYLLIKTLLEQGVSPNIVDIETGNTALHFIASSCLSKAEKKMTSLLFQYGANINALNNILKTPVDILKEQYCQEFLGSYHQADEESLNKQLEEALNKSSFIKQFRTVQYQSLIKCLQLKELTKDKTSYFSLLPFELTNELPAFVFSPHLSPLQAVRSVIKTDLATENLRKEKADKVFLFKKIYIALRESDFRSLTKESDILEERKELSIDDFLEKIKKDIKNKPFHRTATAWKLTCENYPTIDKAGLFYKIYNYSYVNNGLFRRSPRKETFLGETWREIKQNLNKWQWESGDEEPKHAKPIARALRLKR